MISQGSFSYIFLCPCFFPCPRGSTRLRISEFFVFGTEEVMLWRYLQNLTSSVPKTKNKKFWVWWSLCLTLNCSCLPHHLSTATILLHICKTHPPPSSPLLFLSKAADPVWPSTENPSLPGRPHSPLFTVLTQNFSLLLRWDPGDTWSNVALGDENFSFDDCFPNLFPLSVFRTWSCFLFLFRQAGVCWAASFASSFLSCAPGAD